MSRSYVDAEKYFSPDYSSARRRFLSAAERAGARLSALELSVRGPSNEPLAIDVAWLGASRARRVLLHISGVHGVEGFAGSAIQARLLERKFPLPADGALALVHCVNPAGMAWLRRVNENNVDLNRNFLAQPADYRGVPEGYADLHALYNPGGPARADFFRLRLALLMLRRGIKRVQQAGAEGQYEHPDGLFYGGKGLEEGPRLLLAHLKKKLGPARQICAIDVHTGLGAFADEIVILERNQGGPFQQYLQRLYGARLDNTSPDRAQVYHVRGGIEAGVPRLFPDATVDWVTQEFGTVSGFSVLSALRAENRAVRERPLPPGHPLKLALKACFAPADSRWKTSILEKGESLAERSARYLFGA